jgi:hypothetical protein
MKEHTHGQGLRHKNIIPSVIKIEINYGISREYDEFREIMLGGEKRGKRIMKFELNHQIPLFK